MSLQSPDSSSVRKLAFDYAWGYFALHAGQRMQSVNFFLVAVSFLAAAYISAMVGKHPGLAAGVSLVGASSSFVFYRIERRVRGLLHAAEIALGPMERAMAAETDNPGLRILESVDSVPSDAWSYSKVFRILYAVVGLGFSAGTIYAVIGQIALTPNTTSLFPAVLRLASGIALLLFAFESLAGRQTTSVDPCLGWPRRLPQLLPLTLGLIAAVAGIAVLFHLGFWG